MFVVFFKFISTSKCFVLFDVTFLFNFFSSGSKYVLSTKLAISLLVAKFTCANVAAKFSAVSLLNSGVVIYLS